MVTSLRNTLQITRLIVFNFEIEEKEKLLKNEYFVLILFFVSFESI